MMFDRVNIGRLLFFDRMAAAHQMYWRGRSRLFNSPRFPPLPQIFGYAWLLESVHQRLALQLAADAAAAPIVCAIVHSVLVVVATSFATSFVYIIATGSASSWHVFDFVFQKLQEHDGVHRGRSLFSKLGIGNLPVGPFAASTGSRLHVRLPGSYGRMKAIVTATRLV
jgi:hypothetical protein